MTGRCGSERSFQGRWQGGRKGSTADVAQAAAKLGLPDVGPRGSAHWTTCAAASATSGYLADESISGVVYLADRLAKPVLVEGPAGTGKTQLAKSVAELTGARLDSSPVLRRAR